MMSGACWHREAQPPSTRHDHSETIHLAAGARLVPESLLEPPFTNDRRHILHEEAAVLLDRNLRRLARMQSPVELRIARHLGRMRHLSAYIDLGFARMNDYAVERLGLSARRTQLLIQMDRGLRKLPETARAFEAGRLSHSQVRLLIRVATPDTERAWIGKATGMNVRRLEQEVRRARAALTHEGADASAAGEPSASAEEAPPGGGLLPTEHPSSIDEDSEEPHVLVSLPAPAWLRGRWDWAVEIFRRAAGAAAPLWEAAEGIAADYLAGRQGLAAHLTPPEVDAGAALEAAGHLASRPHGVVAAKEADDLPVGLTAAPTGSTADLPNDRAGLALGQPCETSGCSIQDDGIELFEEVQRALQDESGASDWAPSISDIEITLPPDLGSSDLAGDGAVDGAAAMDHQLRGLIVLRQNVAWHQGRLLRTFVNYRLHRALGFASFSRYCRENLGMSARRARLLVALERRLLELPELARAYRNGDLTWVKASEIARVADERTENDWIRLGRSVTVRRLRTEVALALADLDDMKAPWHARRGAPPGLTIEGRVQLSAPGPGPSPNPDTAPAVTRDVGEVQTCARADAMTTRIRFRAPLATSQVWRFALAVCRADEGDHLQDWECVAMMIASFRRTWEFRGSPAWQRRYRIFERDGWRCRVPGCTSRRGLDAHHIVFRSEGGGEEDDNLVAMCATHHLRCLHSGSLRCHRLPGGLLAWEFGTLPGGMVTGAGAAGSEPHERYVEDVLWSAARASVRSSFEEE